MSVYDRDGYWHVRRRLRISRNGQPDHVRVRETTGIPVEGNPGSAEYFASKAKAEEVADQIVRRERRRGDDAADCAARETTLAEAFLRVTRDKVRAKRAKGTLEILGTSATRAFRYFGEDRHVGLITEEDLKSFADTELATLSAHTVHRDIRHVREAVSAAGIKAPAMPNLGKYYTPREKFIEPEDFEVLLKAFDDISDASGRGGFEWRADYITMQAYYDLSFWSLARMERDDLDLEGQWLEIRYRDKRRRTQIVGPTQAILAARLNRPADQPLFPKWYGMPKYVRELCKMAGVSDVTPGTLDKVLDALRDRTETRSGQRKRDYLIMYTHCGLTFSELYRIDPADVDWEAREVFVRGTKAESRARRLPLTPDAYEVLYARASRKPMFDLWNNSNMNRDLARACELVGLEPLCPNDLRRSFATWHARAGTPVLTLQKMMGHSSTRMLEQVYARVERGRHLHDAARIIPRLGPDSRGGRGTE